MTPDPGSQGSERAWVILPAYREQTVIRNTVLEVRRLFRHVVVVDDGSPDATGDEALAGGAVVLRHPFNLGQGAALQTGLLFALDRGADYVATFDADGQHHVEDLVRMLEVLQSRHLDVVLGSRFTGNAEGMPVTRRIALKTAVLLGNLGGGVQLTDAHNGLRVLTASAARRIDLRQDQMAHASEFVAQIRSLRLRCAEAPVTITYSQYSRAKGQRLTNGFRILSDIFVNWLQR